MNNTFNNIKGISLVMVCCLLALFTSCKEDEIVLTPTADLTSLLAEAEDLIANSEEGTQAGDIKPGSIDELQSVVDWVYWTIDNGDDADDIDDAAEKLEYHIEKFNTNLVVLALPYITQEESGTWIAFSDNARDLIAGDFTVEGSFYVVDLNPLDYSNNMFTCVSADDGDKGFELRYFADGSIHINLGNGTSWNQVASEAGTIKAGQWQHIAYTSTAGTAILYIDGVKVLENNNVYELATDNPFIIGNVAPWGANRIMNGLVTDVRFWSGVRTADEINDNKDAVITGEEEGLEAFFPFNADLGENITDVTGNYTATFTGSIEWVAEPPVVEWDNSDLLLAITEMNTFRADVVANEGTTDGNYPVGTTDYIDNILTDANTVAESETRQSEIDDEAIYVRAQIEVLESILVADADGIYFTPATAASYSPNDIGFEIKNHFKPEGDYTIEMMVKVETFALYEKGILFNNHRLGFSYNGYAETTEEAINNAGSLFHFTNSSGNTTGVESDAWALKTETWQHIAAVCDTTAHTTSLYIDGVLIKTEYDLPDSDGYWWGECWIGNGWSNNPLHGSIKDFRIWTAAKDASELNASINDATTEENLEIYFPLDKVAGIQFKDATGNYTGTFKGINTGLVWGVE